MRQTVYLIANAHIDPIWQWELDEGISASLSTFESVCNLLDRYDYVFCHNESMLYAWIERNDPVLFARIRAHVAAGKWKIMGGWYLQPDCNLARGESYVRQIAAGRRYFGETFGARPTVAVNVDPFGHSRGLVQILRKTGFTGYLCCRPSPSEADLPGDEFVWEGLDGSQVRVVRAQAFYNSKLGHVDEKIAAERKSHAEAANLLVLWGVGNHGGGPSAADLEKIAALQAEGEAEYRHATPEEYFAALPADLPVHRGSLNPCMPGCYLSESALKHRFRTLENLYYQTEAMCACAYPFGLDGREVLADAEQRVMLAMFHDVLPGSCIRDAEKSAVVDIDRGIAELSDLRLSAFLRLVRGLKATAAGEYTVLAYNPHPYPVEGVWECEFMLSDQDHSTAYHDIAVAEAGRNLPAQVIRERSNIPIEWRKRVAFRARLEPFAMHKFDCTETVLPARPARAARALPLTLAEDRLRVRFDAEGMLDGLSLDGRELLTGPVRLGVYRDRADSWGMTPDCTRRLAVREGAFERMSDAESSAWSGTEGDLPAVRVIEDGEVFTRVETLCKYGGSAALLTWTVYRREPYVDLDVDVWNNEKSKLFKLEIPCAAERCVREIPFGYEDVKEGGSEHAMLSFCTANGRNGALTVCNDGVFATSLEEGTVALALLRSAAYTAHPLGDRKILPADRFVPRMDQGEHRYRFRLLPGEGRRTAARQAQTFAEPPYVLNMSVPRTVGEALRAPFALDNPDVLLAALRADENGLLLRLVNACEEAAAQTVTAGNWRAELRFAPFEVKTVRIGAAGIAECAEMEV